jgi:CheY-like chemotaxis protein
MTTTDTDNIAFLLVEDDLIDVRTVRRGMRDAGLSNPLFVVGNGEEALAWLRTPGNPTPGVILLDLNMPRMNGIEFLQVMCADPALRDLRVVVLTTSAEDRDRVAACNLCTAGYMVKPVDYLQFIELIKLIYRNWISAERQ